MSWNFWNKVERTQRRSSDPNRIARDARAGFAHTVNQREDDRLYGRASDYGCTSGNDCGAGYSCIDGKCTKVYTRDGSNYKPNTCGDNQIEWQKCEKGQKSGPKDRCQKPTPGNCEKDPECPGEKCCRQQRDGSIRCVCGSCEQTDASRCNVWCDQNFKAFGDVAAGCYTRDMEGFGECGGNICDECQFCENDFFGPGGTCQLGEQDDPFNPLPCHCFSRCAKADECYVCNKDVDSSSFGECVQTTQNCSQCCSISNYVCPQCPKVITGYSHHCEPVTSSRTCINALQDKLYRKCAEECATDPDPCAPTGSTSRCVEGSAPVDPLTNPGGPEGISCPLGKTCQYTGYIEAGGKTCYLYNTWVTADIPAECKECDCNCNNDCKSCEFCNAQGECQTDPECEDIIYLVQARRYVEEVGAFRCNIISYGSDQWEAVAFSTEPTLNYEWRYETVVGFDGNGTLPTGDICGGGCPGEYTYARLVDKDTGAQAAPEWQGFVSGCRNSSVNNQFRYQNANYEVRVIPQTS